MLSITHIVVTLFLVQLLTLDRNDAFIAILFGVFIDLDHLSGLAKYTKANGVGAIFDFESLMNPGGQWKSILHTPMAAAMIAPLSFVSKLGVPLLFWSVHLLMDFVEQNFLGNFSGLEAGLLLFAGLGLASLRYARYVLVHDAPTLGTYIKSEMTEFRALFRARPQTSF